MVVESVKEEASAAIQEETHPWGRSIVYGALLLLLLRRRDVYPRGPFKYESERRRTGDVYPLNGELTQSHKRIVPFTATGFSLWSSPLT